MSPPSDRRSRKRLATRQAISDAATCLFIERGFDHVTVDEIAAAADVGRMTVFNHFPRKEEMFFDRDEEGREMLRDALRQRAPGIAPIETYRLLAHRLVAENSPAVEFSARSQSFIEAIEGSETLKARARAIRDELAQVVSGRAIGMRRARTHRSRRSIGSRYALGDMDRGLHRGSPDLSTNARYGGGESRLSGDCRQGNHRPESGNGRDALRRSINAGPMIQTLVPGI